MEFIIVIIFFKFNSGQEKVRKGVINQIIGR